MHKKAKFQNLASDWESFRRIRNEIIDMIREAKKQYIYNTCALSKHIGNMCMRLRNRGKEDASSNMTAYISSTSICRYISTFSTCTLKLSIGNKKSFCNE